MTEVKIHGAIANEDSRWFFEAFGGTEVFSLERVQGLFEEHPEENDWRFNIHCPGGEVEEGLAIYDCLRTSGRNIYMNIEGACHSMAVVLLLAAPYENRSANPNCRALIHKVQSQAAGSADDLARAADEARQAEESILDIYADRTKLDKETLRSLMAEEKERTASELLEWGFISKVNPYNTNYLTNKQQIMAKSIKQKATELLNSISKFLGQPVNYEFTDENGEVLFTTLKEDDSIEVGDAASPDGDFTLPDGREVVIEGGVITAINEPEPAPDGDPAPDTEADAASLRAENEQLCNLLAQSAETIRELRSNLKSSYVPGNRIGVPSGRTAQGAAAERKNEIRSKLHPNNDNK